MPELAEHLGPIELTEWPDDRDAALDDFVELLTVLSPKSPHEPEDVERDISRVMASESTRLLAQGNTGRIASMVTVSIVPTLTGNGNRIWIDDVATLDSQQRRGYSRKLMGAAEELAADNGSEVYLSSSTKRGVARDFYERSGYRLLNDDPEDPKVIFRSTTIGKDEDPTTPLFVEELTPGFHHDDVSDLSHLLNVEPYDVQRRMLAIVGSPSTRAFMVRALNGEIVGVATANETPIPVGKKPWIDDIAGRDKDAAQMALEAAGKWLGHDYKHVNIVASPGSEFGNGFEMRDSGLYVKRLGEIAAA